jgi:hypothetical protein
MQALDRHAQYDSAVSGREIVDRMNCVMGASRLEDVHEGLLPSWAGGQREPGYIIIEAIRKRDTVEGFSTRGSVGRNGFHLPPRSPSVADRPSAHTRRDPRVGNSGLDRRAVVVRSPPGPAAPLLGTVPDPGPASQPWPRHPAPA